MINVENDEQFMSGGGQMGELIRSMDWSTTALGPVSQWPQSLRTSVSLCLSSTFPILIAWGPELIQIYNDSYRPICGAKHPESMGQNFKICWETALPVVGAAFDRGLGGEGTYIKDQQMLLDRYGYIEEAFMTFSFAPIRDESGNVGGIFHPITETTEQILSARRTQVVRDLAVHTANAKSLDELYRLIAEIVPRFHYDVPFVQIYEADEKGDLAILKTSSGLPDGVLAVAEIDLRKHDQNTWPLAGVIDAAQPVVVNEIGRRFGTFHSGPFDLAPQTALIYPLILAGHERPHAYLVAGLSAVRALDQEYQNFFSLFANTVSSAFSNVDAYLQQQKRAQQLAEIDSAKTAFFSNVSHEFRTPLTLILGPLQQIIDQPETAQALSADNVASMYRNAQRLLKLVNNLLDFSRMEAGRVKAAYEFTDLGSLTADLSSNFRSVIESAGMELRIDVGQMHSGAYVDTDMWEKIVLNLISNAFKYTLEGGVTVRMYEEAGFAVLQVEDTGVGIPDAELPHMFERFHRIENSLGRTHEGTGIGLSLVSELVNLHFGQISLASVFGEGTTFTVKIPLGKKHLVQEQIVESRNRRGSSSQQQTFIREAMSLLERGEAFEEQMPADDYASEDDQDFVIQKQVNVLVVDDNADMRSYLVKLLSPYFSVAFAVNGQDALDKVAERIPDIIVSDVMMPVLDGQQLLRELRLRPGLRIPVILLSARAGEESRLEGLGWSADDYLVKPFSAKELLSKVNSVVKINQITRRTETELRNIFLGAPVAIGIFRGPELLVEVANTMMLQYWGKAGEEMIGKPFSDVFDPSSGDGLEQIVRDVFENAERKMLRDWPLNVLKDGEQIRLYINLVVEPMYDVTGMLNGVMVVANDVTELITALHLVKESEQRFRLLANAMPQLIWRVDRTGGANFYNDFACNYSGLTSDLLRATGLIALVHPDEKEANMTAWQQALATEDHFSYEHRYRRHDGEYRWHLSRAVAQRGASGQIENWVGASTDIHDQKTLEEVLEKRVSGRTAELSAMNEQLVKTNRELEQFAHVTSHDLQEPLRKIQVFSGLVRQKVSEDDETTQDYLRRIIASSERMSHLIKDLLSFARIASVEDGFELTDLNEILNQVTKDFEFAIEQKGAQIISAGLPTIIAAPLQMNQLFYNLIGNALKFADRSPRVEISHALVTGAEAGPQDFLKPGKSYNLLRFSDNGMGFDQHFANRIFTIFQRLDSHRDIEGTGIGLSICKKVVENHQGIIRAEGEPGVGATFEVYLPLERK